ncbi:hypothetical protein UlMin_016204 [Ulmus minor]
MALQLIPKRRTLANPSLIRLFSTSSSSNSGDPTDENDQSNSSPSQSSFSSYFSDVKANLKHQQSTSPPQPTRSTFPNPSFSNSPPKVTSLEEIRKNLSEFRRRSSPPPPDEASSPPSPSASNSPQNISFQELYKRNVIGNGEDSNAQMGGGKVSFDAIRQSLRQLRPSINSQSEKKGTDPMSLSAFKNKLRLNPTDSPRRTTVFGGTDPLPASIFGREMKERKEGERSNSMKTEFVKMYKHEEFGAKLKILRPEEKGDDWFSLEELNERLMKLREMEEKETETRIDGISFKDLRESLVKLKLSEDDKSKKSSIERLDMLGHLGRTPTFMMQPPKEELVEKYFHPDNMSSEEKMKLELAKVREEFKMSESDCGSARVQVAQLTTKIKHLSSVLHKKDKHSRKGLIAMVQRRKKLLKYLRRTDWDSYCFVLSKLGLRDNPDYKH